MMLSSASRRCFSTTTARNLSQRLSSKKNVGSAKAALRLTAPRSASVLSSSRSFSSYSSFAEPNPTLINAPTADQVMAADNNAVSDPNFLLRQDIRVMGSLLGKVVKEHEGEEIFSKVEEMRALALQWREQVGGKDRAAAQATFDKLAAYVQGFTDKELYTVSRSFTHFLALANAAEGHHRARRLQASIGEKPSGALFPKSDSCGGVLPQLLADGHSEDDIFDALCSQTTELVLTAHPTEVNRRTILAKNRRIQEILNQADASRKSSYNPFVQTQLNEALYREVASIWLSDEVSRFKPTPETEAEKGTLVLETVLWEAVPLYLRKLDKTVQEFLGGRRLPLDAAPVKFASWMGGVRII